MDTSAHRVDTSRDSGNVRFVARVRKSLCDVRSDVRYMFGDAGYGFETPYCAAYVAECLVLDEERRVASSDT
jgi:hypothetical protein